MSQFKVTQVKSTIGEKPAARETVRSLGLKRIGHSVIKEDKPEFRGMMRAVAHLVKVEEVK